jgi:hypothetical protein
MLLYVKYSRDPVTFCESLAYYLVFIFWNKKLYTLSTIPDGTCRKIFFHEKILSFQIPHTSKVIVIGTKFSRLRQPYMYLQSCFGRAAWYSRSRWGLINCAYINTGKKILFASSFLLFFEKILLLALSFLPYLECSLSQCKLQQPGFAVLHTGISQLPVLGIFFPPWCTEMWKQLQASCEGDSSLLDKRHCKISHEAVAWITHTSTCILQVSRNVKIFYVISFRNFETKYLILRSSWHPSNLLFHQLKHSLKWSEFICSFCLDYLRIAGL